MVCKNGGNMASETKSADLQETDTEETGRNSATIFWLTLQFLQSFLGVNGCGMLIMDAISNAVMVHMYHSSRCEKANFQVCNWFVEFKFDFSQLQERTGLTHDKEST